MQTAVNEEVFADLESIITACDCQLYDISWVKENSHNILRISIISNNGATTLHQCEKVSENISPFLDTKDLSLDSYVLEVSSPGVERILKTLRHFRLSIGEKIHIKLMDKTEIEATLQSANDEGIQVMLESSANQNDKYRDFAYSELKKVKTIFEW
ncbi:ribosome maturation factor RimP [Helicobacter fennelliae]|uniref:Ribosome maturation factor RimP n=2 Tax=Helicobacter fennelliae TaxID=215 RepID=T1DVW7_9HELI|nr:ribosome maturation factor RimP [Helicobacter fennelliae]GAD18902.1 clustered with transcription termination protein NusA [Helicobacter fennelliae MRY12-0050]SQB98401.1 ribosome maturation factor [Helicobacter fennelliae]STP08540.1 ribosome maturation factor [Helicobacter fennelliae]STQ84351.1 ribosome maturation factor [Helicobacter fennelliae]